MESLQGDKRGSTLTIRLAVDEDAGQYLCLLGSTGQKELKHTVEIRQPPEISKTPKSGHVLAKKGDTVSMKCIGKGDPLPEVSWTRVVRNFSIKNRFFACRSGGMTLS